MEDPLESRLKTVNESNRSTVPPGCSFSPLSRMAVFNLNPNATGCTNETEGCYRLACGGVPKTLVLTVASDEHRHVGEHVLLLEPVVGRGVR